MSLIEYSFVGAGSAILMGSFPCYLIRREIENRNTDNWSIAIQIHNLFTKAMFIFPFIGATSGASLYCVKKIVRG